VTARARIKKNKRDANNSKNLDNSRASSNSKDFCGGKEPSNTAAASATDRILTTSRIPE
jgi:hypothetical protein